MSNVILCDRGDEATIIEEEKTDWVRDVLVALGVDSKVFDIDKIDLMKYLDAREIDVVSDLTSGTVDIYREERLVAQWKVPKLVIIKESPNKWYYEIRLNEWALPFQMRKR